ncbi:MAG TPA: nucleoside phosphorylase, partial [Candidatus Nanoarchaeia archaeon]|nr:nucleoside phosphorylase [Candidatus Nanoarchaeia archaeon]
MQPHLRVDKVSKYCILVGDPDRVNRFGNDLDDVKLIGNNRGLPVLNGKYSGIPITIACTGMGGPSAAIVVEELINTGAKVLIRIGSGAALKKEINTGDPIISTGIFKEETASTAYAPMSFPAIPDFNVLTALVNSAKEQGVFYYGPTICTDGFYTQLHQDTMRYWATKGFVGSEMEGSMIFTIALMRGVKAGMIFHAGLNITNK